MVVSVSRQRKVTYSTLTANLCILGAHVRTATQEGSAIVTLMPARWMVSRVTQVLNALTCRRQLMLLDTHVDPVQPVLPETVLSVQVGGIEVHLCITKLNLHRKPSSLSSSSSSSSSLSSSSSYHHLRRSCPSGWYFSYLNQSRENMPKFITALTKWKRMSFNHPLSKRSAQKTS